MMDFSAAGIQMDIAPKNRDKNIRTALAGMDNAAAAGAGLICLPELFTTAFDYDYIQEAAEPVTGPTISMLCEKAKSLKVFCIAGSIPEQDKGKLYNTSVLIGADGTVIGTYRKTHLFPLMKEDRFFVPGNSVQVFETPVGRIGLMICYDIRFPELARQLALLGADIIIVPAEFPYPRLDHWRTLLRARAIENQLYILAVNRAGVHEGVKFFGNSSLYDPWGDLLAGCGDREAVIYGPVEGSKIEAVRRAVPVFQDRRTDLY